MIALLTGKIAHKSPDHIILDVNGVGYRILIPFSTYYELPEEGGTASLHIHTSVREGNSGATLKFPVTLSGATSKDVTVNYKTIDGTAKAGSDYKATTGTVTIPAGATTGIARVKVLSDKVHENDEQLSVTLGSPSYGTIADRRARGTIVDDDTRVGLHLQQANGHRVRASVDTLPAAPHAPVKVYRVVNGHASLVLSDELNRYGRISRVLDKQYQPGTKVSFYSTVKTDDGLYRSQKVSFTVQ